MQELQTAPAADAAEAPEPPAGRGDRLRGLLDAHPSVNVALVLLVLVAGLSIAYPDSFATIDNFRNIGLDSSILLIIAVGITFLMAAEGLDLSVGSVLVFAGVVGVRLMVLVGGDGIGTIAVGLVGCVAAGVAWGLFNGVLVARSGIMPLIVTLGTFAAAYGGALVISGGQDLNDVPLGLSSHFGYGRVLGTIPDPVVIAGLVALVGGLVLAYTRFGRFSLIVGSNEEAARRAGIRVERHKIKLYALSGLLAGFAGFVSLARFSSTTITGHSADNLNAIVAVVIGGTSLFGGRATMIGTVIGVLIPSVLNNGLVIAGVSSYWQQVATGLLLIAVVYADHARRRRRA